MADELTTGQLEDTTQPSNLFKAFKQRISACKTYRRKLIASWTTSIDYRRGKPFTSQSDEDRVAVNIDWPMVKAKQAALCSQIPQVHVDHAPQSVGTGPWVYAFEQRLNDTLIVAGLETALDEALPDCINAAGIGAVLCAHEALTEYKDVPTQDLSTFSPEEQEQIKASGTMPDGTPLNIIPVPQVTDHRYTITRISPADLLWPIDFTGADFDNAPWIGRSGRVSWAQAQQVFGLTEEDKQAVMGEARTQADRLTHDVDKDKNTDDWVEFDEIFYKEFQYDSKAKSYHTIHHLIFVPGKDEPVVDEPWKGQRQGESGELLGALRFPIRVLTLTYISDETIPPSDSAVMRPQVNEMNKSRTQIMLQRQYSLPLRYADPNRVDPSILQSLMRGDWQGIVPIQGNGGSAIGEVARAAYPPENHSFDGIIRSDIDNITGIGPNQQGDFGRGRQSASESNIVQQNFQTRIGRERAKVTKFIVSIAEVIGGLLCLYDDPSSFGEGFNPAVSRTLSYSILADSTVLMDSTQRREAIKDFINFTAKSGWVNLEPVMRELATLSSLDPNAVIKAPQPEPPAQPNISLRLTGTEDLMLPMSLAMLLKSGQAPTPDLIEQAKKLIELAMQQPLMPEPMAAPGTTTAPPGLPPPMAPPQTVTPPEAPPPGVGEANPQLQAMDKVLKRTESGENS